MKKSTISCITLIIVLFSGAVSASPAWYAGKVSRIALTGGNDGSFIVTFDNSNLDDCMHKYAYFRGSQLGDGRLKHAYTMALTSLTTKVSMGIVIDKSVNGSGGICEAMGMTADLRSN